jgi:hypothetical protein
MHLKCIMSRNHTKIIMESPPRFYFDEKFSDYHIDVGILLSYGEG